MTQSVSVKILGKVTSSCNLHCEIALLTTATHDLKIFKFTESLDADLHLERRVAESLNLDQVRYYVNQVSTYTICYSIQQGKHQLYLVQVEFAFLVAAILLQGFNASDCCA